jgi:hypothetical protein
MYRITTYLIKAGDSIPIKAKKDVKNEMTSINHYANNLTQKDIKTLYYDLRTFIWIC